MPPNVGLGNLISEADGELQYDRRWVGTGMDERVYRDEKCVMCDVDGLTHRTACDAVLAWDLRAS